MFKLFQNALRLGLGSWGIALLLSNRAIAGEVSPNLSLPNAEPNGIPLSMLETDELTQEITAVSRSHFTSVAVLAEMQDIEQGINPNWDHELLWDGQDTGPIDGVEETPTSQQQGGSALLGCSLDQVTSVSQLADVQPTDWAFQALQSLVERYGCLQGYPDGTYRGNRILTRYEFAAGLNACLERLNQHIQTSTGAIPTPEDLAMLQRLQTEFAIELADLSIRLDPLEASITQLERQRFSPTTVLNGETLVAVSGVGGEDVNGNDIDANIVLSNRVELNFSTSFFGQDLLRARLGAGNTPDFAEVTGTNLSRLSFTGDNNNDIQLGAVFYRFPIGEQAVMVVSPQGIGFGDFTPTLNPYINSSLLGNVGNFSGESAIYGLNGGRGVGLEYRFNRAVLLSVGYLPSAANNPTSGLFSGPYGAITQLTLFPTPSLSVGLTYVRSYNLVATGRGSRNAEDPFAGAATSTNSYGLEASYQVSPTFNISGWLGLINAQAESNPHKGSDASIFTWALTFALPDLGGEGNLAGFIIGQPPKVIKNDVTGREDPDTSLHLEAFYRFQVTGDIAITPGFFVVTNPDHNANNSLIYVGTIRTSFVF